MGSVVYRVTMLPTHKERLSGLTCRLNVFNARFLMGLIEAPFCRLQHLLCLPALPFQARFPIE